jgi:hypothetical protein
MGKKYVIELEDEPFVPNIWNPLEEHEDQLWRVKGFQSLVFDQYGLEKLEKLDEQNRDEYVQCHLEKQNIQVGDEVVYQSRLGTEKTMIVTNVGESILCGLDRRTGEVYRMDKEYILSKTGRHFDLPIGGGESC